MPIEVTTYLRSILGSPPHVKRREEAPNLKRWGKKRNEQNHVLSEGKG